MKTGANDGDLTEALFAWAGTENLEERVEAFDEAFTAYDTVSEGGDPSYADADEIRADDRGGER